MGLGPARCQEQALARVVLRLKQMSAVRRIEILFARCNRNDRYFSWSLSSRKCDLGLWPSALARL